MPPSKKSFWQEYDKVSDTSDQYQCKHCQKKYMKNATRQQEHLEKCKNYQNYLQEQETILPNISTTGVKRKTNTQTTLDGFTYKFNSQNQSELEQLLARAFFSAGIAFNVIENEDFCAFINKASPSFKIPSRYELSNTILNSEYKLINDEVQDILEKREFVSITTDGWSNIHRSSIINYMVTTPKPIFYKSVPTKEERHTAQNIAAGIKQTIEEIGEKKVVAVVTDNAANMKAAWAILKQEYPHKVNYLF